MEDKKAELERYHDLVIATIDYYLNTPSLHFETDDLDTKSHYENLRLIATEDYKKGRLTKLKRWFRDLTEMQVETRNLKFNKYLQDKTNYKIDIFESYNQRVDKIIERGRITSDNQFYDINILVDQLSQVEPIDNDRIIVLNRILGAYEARKLKK